MKRNAMKSLFGMLLLGLLASQPALAVTWYLEPIQTAPGDAAQQAVTKEFTNLLIKAIKINEYQVGKPLSKEVKDAKWVVRSRMIPASDAPLTGKKHEQNFTYGNGAPTHEIVAEVLRNGVLVAHIGQGWREPQVAGTPIADKITVVTWRYAVGADAKPADLEELAAMICFEAGKVIARDGKPIPERKKKEDKSAAAAAAAPDTNSDSDKQ